MLEEREKRAAEKIIKLETQRVHNATAPTTNKHLLPPHKAVTALMANSEIESTTALLPKGSQNLLVS